MVIPVEMGDGSLVGVQVFPSTDSNGLDSDGRHLIGRETVHQAIPWPSDTIRIEVELVAVRQVACSKALVELDSLDSAIADQDEHVKRHLLRTQVGQRIDVLLKAGERCQLKTARHYR